MIHVLIEENYSDNNRFHALLDGISATAKKKHLDVALYKTVDEIAQDCRVAVLICASLKWAEERIAQLCRRNIHPLIFGMEHLNVPHVYSSVVPDYVRAAYSLTKYLLSFNKGTTALVGYNEDSQPDRSKYTGVRQALQEMGTTCKVFENRGDVMACLDCFAADCENVENIVCCNDNVAVTLYVRYPQLLQGRRMCSFSGLKLSEFFDEPYPVCRIDYYKAGEQLADLYTFLCKGKDICATAMTFAMDFFLGTERLELSFAPSMQTESKEKVDFYGDKNLQEMERLDKMLSECDDTDVHILRGLADGKTYEYIAEREYLAVNTVKYRVKKMLSTAGADNKKQLLSLLEEYRIKFKK